MAATEDAEELLDSLKNIENGWYLEKWSDAPHGVCGGLQVTEVLLQKRTKFQEMIVFKSAAWGNVLVLDGIVQITERDECSYQEMMAHLPMFSHRDPRHVLIIGGGDGGILREVCKHKVVEKATMVEIDGDVVETSRKFLPTVSCSLDHPKANLIIGDGVDFAQKASDSSYDVIIVDSSDPVGPNEKLFTKEFYQNAFRILKPGGVMCSQGETLWMEEELIIDMIQNYGKPFASAEYATIHVPTYPTGQLGAFVARKTGYENGSTKTTCRTPVRAVPEGMQLKYYSEDMHYAAFALPVFLAQKLYGVHESPGKKQKIES